MIRFAAPGWAILLLAAPLLMALARHSAGRQRQALGAWLSRAPGPPGTRFALGRSWLAAGAITGLVLALMQPQWGEDRAAGPRQGRDLVVFLDTSLSMLADDVQPNRLALAKAALAQLVAAIRTEGGGDRLSLLAFAGQARLLCPPTQDYDLFLTRLAAAGTDSVPEAGTLIGDALRHGLERVPGIASGFADLILVSDGEDHGSLPLGAAQLAVERGFALYSLGVGDATAGALLSQPGVGGLEPIRHAGLAVRSRLQPEVLASLAAATGGAYLGTADDGALAGLYREVITHKPPRPMAIVEQPAPAERYRWFLLPALLLLALDLAWPRRTPAS